MKKDWELYAIEIDFLMHLAKFARDEGDDRSWEIQGQRLAREACRQRGFETYVDIGGWVENICEKDNWFMPKPHLLEGIKEAQRKYSNMGDIYKFYLLWNNPIKT